MCLIFWVGKLNIKKNIYTMCVLFEMVRYVMWKLGAPCPYKFDQNPIIWIVTMTLIGLHRLIAMANGVASFAKNIQIEIHLLLNNMQVF